MAGLQRARRLSGRPLVVAVLLLAFSLVGAARPAPAAPIPAAAIDRGPAVPALTATPPERHGIARAARAPIVDVIPAGPEPRRPVVEVPQAQPVIVFGPGSGSTAVFLGDSFTSGSNGAGLGARGWPRLVSDERGWRTVNLAVAGTGFMNPGWTGQPIGSLVAKAASLQPDVIVLAGGHNDSRWSASATAAAATDVIDRLRAAAPDALLVVVAPIWQDGSPPARCLALRDRLQAKSAKVGAVFIDPLADGWFGGSSHKLIGSDGLHPTDAGHRFIAGKVLEALGR